MDDHFQTGTVDPFIDSTAYDFHLNAATDAGLSLTAPYNTDMSGSTRGGDGNWDRGAYEYSGN